MNVIGLIFLIALIVGAVFLQIFLSRRASPLPGLTLPVLFGLLSLIFPLNVAVPSSGVTGELVMLMVVVLLLANIPTALFLAVYFAVRGKERKKKQMEKLNIQDL